MQADGLADVESQFIQGGSLGDHGKVEALGYILAFASGYTHLDRSLHGCIASDSSMHQDRPEPLVRDRWLESLPPCGAGFRPPVLPLEGQAPIGFAWGRTRGPTRPGSSLPGHRRLSAP